MIALALAAFLQTSIPPKPSDPVSKLTQAKLNAMSDACRAPRSWLRQLGSDQVRFQPTPTAKYAKIDCVLKRLRRGASPTKIGFIGNETLSMDDSEK